MILSGFPTSTISGLSDLSSQLLLATGLITAQIQILTRHIVFTFDKPQHVVQNHPIGGKDDFRPLPGQDLNRQVDGLTKTKKMPFLFRGFETKSEAPIDAVRRPESPKEREG
jgi:hypothetical protein